MFFPDPRKGGFPAGSDSHRRIFAILLVLLLILAAIAWVVRGDGPGAAASPAVASSAGVPGPGTHVAGCPVFPKSNPWNRDISKAPVDHRSDAYVRSIGLNDTLHADFGSGRYGDYGIPFRVVGRGQNKVPVHFTAYGSESDRGPYPVPLGTRIEGGSDNHVIVVQKGSCRLYEMYRARRGKGRWLADSGAKFDLRSNALRPAGWTSADAAGLPIYPGLAKAVWSGLIRTGGLLYRRAPVGVILVADGVGRQVVRRPSDAGSAVVRGSVAELVMYSYGRKRAADVKITGPQAAVAALTATDIAL